MLPGGEPKGGPSRKSFSIGQITLWAVVHDMQNHPRRAQSVTEMLLLLLLLLSMSQGLLVLEDSGWQNNS